MPRSLSPEKAAGFATRLFAKAASTDLDIEFGGLVDVAPYGVLLAAAAIRQLVRARSAMGLHTGYAKLPATDATLFLRKIGFFRFVGIEHGDWPRAIFREDHTFIAISEIPRIVLDETGNRIQNDLKAISDQVAAYFCSQTVPSDFADPLSYCVRELVRNSFEHAGVDVVHFLIDMSNPRSAELAILDEGIGIAESLGHAFGVLTPRNAVTLALKPGITEYQGPETSDQWQNTGFGLYVLSELGRQFGSFSICSSGSQLTVFGKRSAVSPAIPVNGTVAGLRLHLEEPEYFSNIRAQIVARGEMEAAKIPGARTQASAASRGKLLWT